MEIWILWLIHIWDSCWQKNVQCYYSINLVLFLVDVLLNYLFRLNTEKWEMITLEEVALPHVVSCALLHKYTGTCGELTLRYTMSLLSALRLINRYLLAKFFYNFLPLDEYTLRTTAQNKLEHLYYFILLRPIYIRKNIWGIKLDFLLDVPPISPSFSL